MSLISELSSLIDINDLNNEIVELTPVSLIRNNEHADIDISIPANGADDEYHVITYSNKYLHIENVDIIKATKIPVFTAGEYQ